MQEVEAQLREDSLAGLKHRDARLLARHNEHVEQRERAAVLELAKSKVKDHLEEARRHSSHVRTGQTLLDAAIADEMDQIRAALPQGSGMSIVSRSVHVTLVCTEHRQLVAKLQFLEDYPRAALVTQLQSSTLAPALLEKLTASCDAIAAQHREQPHALAVLQLLLRLVFSNQLATAFDELQQLRDAFAGTACRVVNTKQACGGIAIELHEGTYKLCLALRVPPGYPAEALHVRTLDHNLPERIVQHLNISCSDLATRRASYQMAATDVLGAQARAGSGTAACSKTEVLARSGMQTMTSYSKGQHLASAARDHAEEAKRRRAREAAEFVPSPSLFDVVNKAWATCLKPLAAGRCPVCSKRLLPSDSAQLLKIPKAMQVIEVNCGHFYHFRCIEDHISCPPFGKRCHTCDAPIEHTLLTTNTKVLEARWASKQAKQRELDEIRDFLG